MTKKLFIMCAALVWTVSLMAQKIAVVSADGSTKVYQTLQAAIEGADPGSVVYLPGGGFPIADEVKITKKLTIIGIGHKIKTENPDGYTTVGGNLFFDQGSDGSALMGCYLTGGVYIGNDGNEVDDLLIRCNNIKYVEVKNDKCLGTNINQNYIREYGRFRGASARFTNNIVPYITNLQDGYISNNIVTSAGYDNTFQGNLANWNWRPLMDVHRSSVMNNIIFDARHYGDDHPCWCGSDLLASGNMCPVDISDDDDCINVGSVDWNNVFVDYKGITPSSDFHFKEDYAKYEGQVGIYHGNFNDDQLAPVPYIVAKSIPEQTDAAGKLKIKIRVKAGDAGGDE